MQRMGIMSNINYFLVTSLPWASGTHLKEESCLKITVISHFFLFVKSYLIFFYKDLLAAKADKKYPNLMNRNNVTKSALVIQNNN